MCETEIQIKKSVWECEEKIKNNIVEIVIWNFIEMNNHEEKIKKYANDQVEKLYGEIDEKNRKKSSKILPAKNVNNS